jgi:hypothetical protein
MVNESKQPDALPQGAITALRGGNVIEAIKLVRLERDIGLKEAKDQVDAYLRSQPALKKKLEEAQAETRQSLSRWLILLLAIGALIAYFFIAQKPTMF